MGNWIPNSQIGPKTLVKEQLYHLAAWNWELDSRNNSSSSNRRLMVKLTRMTHGYRSD